MSSAERALTSVHPKSCGSDTTTEGVRVVADARYLPAESDPQGGQHLFAYRVVITNAGDVPVRLVRRHWVILDADHNREDVKGEGVVGKQPRLLPGQSFAYTSGCPLRTRWGTMEGWYEMEDESGRRFRARIGRFYLVPAETALRT
jgi:ApaG protein